MGRRLDSLRACQVGLPAGASEPSIRFETIANFIGQQNAAYRQRRQEIAEYDSR